MARTVPLADLAGEAHAKVDGIGCSIGTNPMAKGRDSYDTLRENQLGTQLIARGAATAMILRGFIGPAAREGHVLVYPRIQNLLSGARN